jgi:glutaredoxin-related protein
MVLASFLLYRNVKEQSQKFRFLKVTLITIFTLATFGASAYEMATTYEIPTYTVGTNTESTFLQSFTQAGGKTIVFIFSPTCPHCADKVEEINKIATQTKYDRILGIYGKMDNEKAIDNFKQSTKPNFDIVEFPLDSVLKATRSYPYFLILENNRIIRTSSNP